MNPSKAFGIFAVLIALSLPIAFAQEPEMKYDEKERLIMLDYPGTSDDVSYEYYGDSDSLKKITAADAVYEYDENGQLTSEKYPSNPEKDRTYTYYEDGSLRSVSGGGSAISYTYDYGGRVTAVYTEIDGNILFERYTYYPDGSLKSVENAAGMTTYVYDGAGNIIQEAIEDYAGATARVFYEYDGNGNIVRAYDSNGNDLSWDYEDVPYACTEMVCRDEECSDFDLLNTTCTYSRLKSRTVGNYRVSLNYSDLGVVYQDNAGSERRPMEVYDDNGLLVEDDEYYYTYNSDYQLASATSKLTGETARYTTNDDGLITRAEYSTGGVEDYYYDPLGQVIKVVHTSSDGASKTYYAATAGDLGTLVEESAISFAPTGSVVLPPAAGPETVEPESGQPAPVGGPDYLLSAIIGIAVLIVAFIVRSRMRGR